MVTIVISGMPGCGSSTTAKLLAKRLGLKHFSAGDYFKSFSEGKETERAINLLKTEKGSSKKFHVALDEKQKAVAKKGNVVIDSKLGITMLKGIADFSVWLKADDAVRAKRVSGRDFLSIQEAKKIINERDTTERGSFKKIYGFDTFDQEKDADMVVDTGRYEAEDRVELIIKELRKRKLL